MRYLVAVIFSLVSVQAYAAKWYPVAVSNAMMIFVDKDSVKKTGGTAKFWQWQLFGRQIGKTDSAKSLVVMDCKKKERRTEYMIAIAEIDIIQQEGKVDPKVESIQPNSLEYAVYNAVCNNKFTGQPQSTVNLYDVRSFLYRVQ
jgi:hypothetical protein